MARNSTPRRFPTSSSAPATASRPPTPRALSQIDPREIGSDVRARAEAEALPPNTTALAKTTADSDDASDDIEKSEVRVVKAGRGDTLVKILTKAGSDVWQARAMTEVAKAIFPESALTPGQEIHVTLVPSLTKTNQLDPSRFSVYDDGHIHRVTVARNSAGEFTASETPPGVNIAARAAMAESDQPQSSSVYSSLYHATLTQNVPPESITQILRIHAYDTDFRRRIRAGDMVEFFFDMKDEAAATGPPGELLYTSVTVGGETSKFWRFRTPEGVDYYDEQGNNSKKFLMRRPVRSEDVRLDVGLRRALPPAAQRAQNAHRRRLGRAHRHADPRRRHRRDRGGRTQGLQRQLRPHPARQRLSNRLQPHVAHCAGRPAGHQDPPGRRSSATSDRPACRQVRICTTRCWSTAASSIPCRSRCRASASFRASSSPTSRRTARASTS